MKSIGRAYGVTKRASRTSNSPRKSVSFSPRSARFCDVSNSELSMIAVIFEVWPDRRDDYLDIAAERRPHLNEIDGFISFERFESLTEKGKMLSLSFFRDETAVEAWRNIAEHRAAQAKGRGGIFKNYRLRIAGVIRDYGMNDRAQAPKDSKAVHNKAQ